MKTKFIGGSDGLEVTLVGVGCNAFGKRVDEKGTHAVMDAAIDAGINFFDTAETYGGGLSEQFIGSGLKGRRNELLLATKFGHTKSNVEGANKGSPANIQFTIEKALKALKTDRVDLFQQHRPDPDTPVAETMGALEDLVKEGKIRYYGCSYYSGAQMQEAIDTAKSAGLKGFVTAQNAWNMLMRDIEEDLIPVCNANGIGLLPYYPIAKGLLTGKYKRGEAAAPGSRMDGDASLENADFDLLDKLETYAKDHGHDLLTLAMSWLASQPSMACIISGASKPEQLASNANAVRWELSADELAEVDTILAA
ncbi:MAG: aldo/keto reductase [Rhodospirillaceae bacterium]|nr:aldo/keto reductase [Rhodospirillaceae bacterium]HAA91064.1 aldo/keto reductase [Rhodospirillaceae bacterium]|tara:strand:- start:539 stop:1465 length:927 start_codon:yes stop_codon:yes gene_type:complete